MSTTRIATVAAAATIALVALGGTALAVGTADPTPVPSPAAGSASTSAPTSSATPTSTDTAAPAAPAAAVDRERAAAIALERVGGGRVTGVESETEHGRAVWEVEIVEAGTEHDLDVDAATGEVTRVDVDHDDDRDDRDDDGDDHDRDDD